MKKFLFIRHGQTDWSAELIKLGPVDYPLNERGRAEAMKAASYAKSVIPTGTKPVIVASPLLRARQTAEIISEYCAVPINFEHNLSERYFGDARTGSIDAESDEVFAGRVRVAFNLIQTLTEIPDQYVIIVSHSLVFKQITEMLSAIKEPITTGGCVELGFEKAACKELVGASALTDSKDTESSTHQARLSQKKVVIGADRGR